MPPRQLIAGALKAIAPGIPNHELGAVLDHALDSREFMSKNPEDAAWLSLVAYIRHVFTDYDELLASGYDVQSARHFVVDEINATLALWRSKRSV